MIAPNRLFRGQSEGITLHHGQLDEPDCEKQSGKKTDGDDEDQSAVEEERES